MAGPILLHSLDVWDALGGHKSTVVIVGTPDVQHGLVLEFSHLSEDASGQMLRDVYELMTWGAFETAVAKRARGR
jgi:hypothetical protein